MKLFWDGIYSLILPKIASCVQRNLAPVERNKKVRTAALLHAREPKQTLILTLRKPWGLFCSTISVQCPHSCTGACFSYSCTSFRVKSLTRTQKAITVSQPRSEDVRVGFYSETALALHFISRKSALKILLDLSILSCPPICCMIAFPHANCDRTTRREEQPSSSSHFLARARLPKGPDIVPTSNLQRIEHPYTYS